MIVANGATDVITYWVLRDSTTHAPKTSVTITDIDIYYVEEGAAISSKTDLTALSAATDSHTDNKGIEIGQGIYRIDWPDACFDGGAGKKVILAVVCSGVDTTFLEVELSPTATTATTIKKNTAYTNFMWLMIDSTDHVTPKTGLTVTCQRSIDGAAFANCNTATATEVANGIYKVNLAASDLNGDFILLKFTATGADARYIEIKTVS